MPSIVEQTSRNNDRLAILNNELLNEKDPNNQTLLRKEIEGTNKANASGDPFTVMSDRKKSIDPVYEFFNSGSVPKNIESKVSEQKTASNDQVYDFFNSGKIPGTQDTSGFGQGTPEGFKSAKAKLEEIQPSIQTTYKEPSLGEKAIGVGEAGLNAVTGIPAMMAGNIRGVANRLGGASMPEAEKIAADTAQELTYQPRTEPGQEYAAKLGEVASAVPPMMMPGLPLKAKMQEAMIKRAAIEPNVVEDAKPPSGATNLDVPTVLRKQLEARQAAEGKPAARDEIPKTEEPTFKEADHVIAKPGEKLPLQEQSKRADILERVGIPREKQRDSAVQGDPSAAKGDFDQTKMLQEPAGVAAKAHFDSERSALENHATQIIKDTGGTVPKELWNMDSDLLHTRGTSIANPFDNLKSVLDEKTKQLYAAKDAEAGGAPSVNLGKFKDLIERDSAFEGKAHNQSLRSGIKAYLREQNIVNKDGSFNPITAQAAEGIRQYINSQYSYETSGLAGKIKNAIDKDVFTDVGKDIYEPARQLHALKKATLDNPTGISKLMDYDPNTPINRAVAFEKIPDFVSRLPNDQFSHVIKVLKDMPPELQPQAQGALSEIKAHMANKIAMTGTKFKGQWNEKGVSKELSDNQSKLKLIFTPEELSKFSDLNEAGKILKVDTSYLGAAPQAAGLMKRGMINFLPKITTSTGAMLGSMLGPLGAGAGAAIGEGLGLKKAQSMAESSALESWNNRVGKASTKLKDVKP